MKNTLFILLLVVLTITGIKADGQDTVWLRYTSPINELDFTPDDNYVIAWNENIEFWDVQQGIKEFFITTETIGDYNYNEEFLVFAQDSTPKLLNWQTREVVEGFENQEAFLGRIKTAKSKNEFMATKGHHPKVIYFWDINQKQILDSFEITKEFEKDNQKWGRSIHEYDFVGNNDEFFYIRVNDNNGLTPNLPAKNEIDNFSYLIYNRESKELVDSLFAFQITTDNYNHVDKMVVMNDRTKLAWNHKSGEIYYYSIGSKSFINQFSRNDFSVVNDIEFTSGDNEILLTYGDYIKMCDVDFGNELTSFNIGTYGQCKLSRNKQLMVGNIEGYLILHPATITSIGGNQNQSILTLSPNPTINNIRIEINSENFEFYKLSLIDINGNLIDIIENEVLNDLNKVIDYDITFLFSGVYFIRLEVGNDIITKQFIKE